MDRPSSDPSRPPSAPRRPQHPLGPRGRQPGRVQVRAVRREVGGRAPGRLDRPYRLRPRDTAGRPAPRCRRAAPRGPGPAGRRRRTGPRSWPRRSPSGRSSRSPGGRPRRWSSPRARAGPACPAAPRPGTAPAAGSCSWRPTPRRCAPACPGRGPVPPAATHPAGPPRPAGPARPPAGLFVSLSRGAFSGRYRVARLTPRLGRPLNSARAASGAARTSARMRSAWAARGGAGGAG